MSKLLSIIMIAILIIFTSTMSLKGRLSEDNGTEGGCNGKQQKWQRCNDTLRRCCLWFYNECSQRANGEWTCHNS